MEDVVDPAPSQRLEQSAFYRELVARIGAEPVPVQIITIELFGWLGMRKLLPKGPMTCTLSPT